MLSVLKSRAASQSRGVRWQCLVLAWRKGTAPQEGSNTSAYLDEHPVRDEVNAMQGELLGWHGSRVRLGLDVGGGNVPKGGGHSLLSSL